MTEGVERVLSKLAERVKEVQWTLDGSMFEEPLDKGCIRTVPDAQCPLEFLTGRSFSKYGVYQIAFDLSVNATTIRKIAKAADGVFLPEETEKEVQEIRQKLLEMTELDS